MNTNDPGDLFDNFQNNFKAVQLDTCLTCSSLQHFITITNTYRSLVVIASYYKITYISYNEGGGVPCHSR